MLCRHQACLAGRAAAKCVSAGPPAAESDGFVQSQLTYKAHCSGHIASEGQLAAVLAALQHIMLT